LFRDIWLKMIEIGIRIWKYRIHGIEGKGSMN